MAYGAGSLGFESCIFNYWDAINDGRAAIQVRHVIKGRGDVKYVIFKLVK